MNQTVDKTGGVEARKIFLTCRDCLLQVLRIQHNAALGTVSIY